MVGSRGANRRGGCIVVCWRRTAPEVARSIRRSAISTLGIALLVALVACGPSNMPEGVPVDTVVMEASELYQFRTISEMVTASDLVVVGTVSDIVPFKLEEASGDQPGLQLVSIALDIDEVLKGQPREPVTFGWNGWDVAADGTIGPRRVISGVDIPMPGERYVLFLFELSDEERTSSDYPLYGLTSFDGILRVEGEDLVTTVEGDRLAHELAAMSLEELSNQIGAGLSP